TDRRADPAAGLGELVVADDERAVVAHAIRIGEDVLVDRAIRRDEIVEPEVLDAGEERPAMEQREDLALVALDEPAVRALVPQRPAKLHAVLLGESLDLAVAEHREAGQGR